MVPICNLTISIIQNDLINELALPVIYRSGNYLGVGVRHNVKISKLSHVSYDRILKAAIRARFICLIPRSLKITKEHY